MYVRALHIYYKNTMCATNASLSFYLKFLDKKGHNSKIIAFKVMPLALQLLLVMMVKCVMFGVDTLKTF